jgi:tetratricopeptide (TPR) repeat protein
VAALFGCGAGERSYLHLDWRNGIFMQAVIRGMSGEADQNQDRQVTVDELAPFVQAQVADYLRKEYPARSAGQKPQLLGGAATAAALTSVQGVLRPYSQGCGKFFTAQYGPAAADFTQALAIEPRFTAALVYRAAAALYTRDYPAALRDCDDARGADGRNPEPWMVRGEVHMRMGGKEEEAVKDFTEAIQVDPRFSSPYTGRAQAYRALGSYDKAITDHNTAVTLAPDDPYARNSRGVTYARMKDWDRAVQDYEKAIALNPNLYMPYENLAVLYANKGDAGKSQEWREKAKTAKSLTRPN